MKNPSKPKTTSSEEQPTTFNDVSDQLTMDYNYMKRLLSWVPRLEDCSDADVDGLPLLTLFKCDGKN